MSGYSGTPLVQKLGIKSGFRVAFPEAPETFPALLGDLPERVVLVSEGPIDLAVTFVKSRADLLARFALAARRLTPAGILWVAWPKKASGMATDLNENVVRDVGLAAGLVDTKVCAIDEIWSGLKFVIRLKDRPTTGTGRDQP